MGKLVAKRYASALFEASKDLNKEDVFFEEVEILKNILDSEEDFYKILSHPRIKRDEKKDIVSEIFGEVFSKEIINFLYILIDKRRERNLYEILEEYLELYNEYKGIINVTAVTAVEMTEEAKNRLTSLLQSKLEKTIYLENKVNPELIGGVLLQVGDKLIDGTIKNELESFGRAMK